MSEIQLSTATLDQIYNYYRGSWMSKFVTTEGGSLKFMTRRAYRFYSEAKEREYTAWQKLNSVPWWRILKIRAAQRAYDGAVLEVDQYRQIVLWWSYVLAHNSVNGEPDCGSWVGLDGDNQWLYVEDTGKEQPNPYK